MEPVDASDDHGDEGDAQGEDNRGRAFGPYMPPCEHNGRPEHFFGSSISEHFVVPDRLRTKPTELIETVNDWHFAMINDVDRNHFYQDALRKVITKDSVVLEIGAGSGLLSIMAALAGARLVIAIEANRELANLAARIVQANRMDGRVQIINKMSTDVDPDELMEEPTVLVSEILGTLLLGESALHYVQDARERLLLPGAVILPAKGTQFVTLIQSEEIRTITAVRSWEGIDLRAFNELQDTTSLVFTKQYGFRFSSCKHTLLSDRVPVLEVDFNTACTDTAFPVERRVRFQAIETGIAHAALATWDVSDDVHGSATMSTDPRATQHNFPRDMQWGQALQLLEDLNEGEGAQPRPLRVTKGEWLTLVVRYSSDGVNFQVQVERDRGQASWGKGRANGAGTAALSHDSCARAQGPSGTSLAIPAKALKAPRRNDTAFALSPADFPPLS